MFYLTDMAEFLTNELAQNAVTLAVKDTHFLDAQQFGFIQILIHDIQGFFGSLAAHIKGEFKMLCFLAEILSDAALPTTLGLACFGAAHLAELVGAGAQTDIVKKNGGIRCRRCRPP